jgi:hypothetical protein
MCASDLRTLDVRWREYYLEWSGPGYALRLVVFAGIRPPEQQVERNRFAVDLTGGTGF